jgi:hypothetical protein
MIKLLKTINKKQIKLLNTSSTSGSDENFSKIDYQTFSGVCSKEENNHLYEFNSFENIKYVKTVEGNYDHVLYTENKRLLSYFAEFPVQLKRGHSFNDLSRKVLCYNSSMIMFVFKFKSYENFINIMEDLRNYLYQFNNFKFQIGLPEKKTIYYYSYFCTFIDVKLFKDNVLIYINNLKKKYNKNQFDFYDISKNVKKHVNRDFESHNLIIFNKSLSINLYKDKLGNLYIHSSNFNFTDYFVYIEKGVFYTQYYCTFIFSKNPFVKLELKLKYDCNNLEPINISPSDSPDEQKKTFLKILALQLLSINKRNKNDGALIVPYDLTISAIFKIQEEYIEKKTNKIKILEFYLVQILVSNTLDLNDDVSELLNYLIKKEKEILDHYQYCSIACLGYEFAIVDV